SPRRRLGGNGRTSADHLFLAFLLSFAAEQLIDLRFIIESCSAAARPGDGFRALVRLGFVFEGDHLAAALGVLGRSVALLQRNVEVGAFRVGVGLTRRGLLARLLVQRGHLEVGRKYVLFLFVDWSQAAAVVQGQLELAVRTGIDWRSFHVEAQLKLAVGV